MLRILFLTVILTIVGLVPLAPLFLHPPRGKNATGSSVDAERLTAWIPPVARYWIRHGLCWAWFIAGGVLWWKFAIQGLTLRFAAGRTPGPRHLFMIAIEAVACSACVWAALDAWLAARRNDPRKPRG